MTNYWRSWIIRDFKLFRCVNVYSKSAKKSMLNDYGAFAEADGRRHGDECRLISSYSAKYISKLWKCENINTFQR